jgi:hypothetical protein
MGPNESFGGSLAPITGALTSYLQSMPECMYYFGYILETFTSGTLSWLKTCFFLSFPLKLVNNPEMPSIIGEFDTKASANIFKLFFKFLSVRTL